MIAQNKGPEARSALQWLRGQNVDISFELADMETANILSKKQAFKIKELFKSAYLKPLGVSLGLMFAQQFSGINAVMFYSVSIFRVSVYLSNLLSLIFHSLQDAGSSIDSNICTIILGIVNIIATLFSNFFIDRLGRKILLYISSIGMIFSLGIFGAYFYMRVSFKANFPLIKNECISSKKDVESYEAPGWIPLLALMVYVVSFSFGYGPVPWLMMAEIFPSRIRGPAASLATAFNWTCTFIVTNTFMNLQVKKNPKFL